MENGKSRSRRLDLTLLVRFLPDLKSLELEVEQKSDETFRSWNW